MEITFFGGAGEVGRNCILVEDEGEKLLLDCGVKLGEIEEYPLLAEEDIPKLSKIAISHTHLDHMGYLPYLYMRGCRADIFATKPTRDLIQLLLADYLRIKKGKDRFRNVDINEVMKYCRIVEYGRTIGEGLTFSFHRAGHILGSAMIRVYGKKTLLYTSDTSWRETKMLDSLEKGLEAEVMIIESTYGGKEDVHPSMKNTCKKICESINQSIGEGGKVLIPSFAVGRAQEILLLLESYMNSGVMKKAPIFIDGMIKRANRIYRQNVIYAKDELQRRILLSDDDPFKSKLFKTPRRKDRKDVLESEGAIIITTSGMLSGGPVLQYLKALASDKKNKLLLVGYQAEGTLGRKLLEGAKKVLINGEEVEVNLCVEKIPLSAHSDHRDLIQLTRNIKNLKKVIIIHGEGNKPKELGRVLENFGYEVIIPKNLETLEL